jgi:methyl-accepting chemotaxis protein
MLSKLKIGVKLALVGALFSIPLAFATYLFSEASNQGIDFAESELQGDQYLRPLSAILVDVAAHRGLHRAALAGNSEATALLGQRATALDSHFKALHEVHDRLSGPLKVTLRELELRKRTGNSLPNGLEASWRRLKQEATTPELSERMHDALLADVRALIVHVGDTSKLILDPDLDTYYTMDALLIRLPEVVDRMSDLSTQVDQLLLVSRPLTLKERNEIWASYRVLEYHVESLKADKDTAVTEAAEISGLQAKVAAAFEPGLRTMAGAMEKVSTLGQRAVAGVAAPEKGQKVDPSAPLVNVTAQEWGQAGLAVVDGSGELWRALFDVMDQMMVIRQGKVATTRNGQLIMVLLAVAATLVVTYLVMRSITVPIAKARAVADMLARGELPDKIEVGNATDETGLLLRSINSMLQFLDLRNTMGTLQQSAALLTDAVANLERQTDEQGQGVTRQAAALQETQVTAQEIRQTSQLAAQKAEQVIQVAERAEEVSRAGETAVEKSVMGLTDIKAQVDGIAGKISELSERTQQIGGITQTVKDLADQSNMLALNAAIEAVRSGEHGKGFAVVAREIRSLADQSIQATNRVREILDSIGAAIQLTVGATESGGKRIQAGLYEVKASGDNLRELSGIVTESSQSVRQIAAAVNQQNAGIAQIFSAVTEQTKMMDETVQRLDATRQATLLVKDVTIKVAELVKRYKI